MQDRKSVIKKRSIFLAISYCFWFILILGFFAYDTYIDYFPPKFNIDNYQLEKEYAFTVIKAVEPIEVEGAEGWYSIISLTPDQDVIYIYAKEEQKDELLKATAEQPVTINANLTKYQRTDEETDELIESYAQYAKENHFPEMRGFYYDLDIEQSPPVELDMFYLVAWLIGLAAGIFLVVNTIYKMNKAVAFYEENPLYNEYEADKTFHKNVELVRNYILVTGGRPAQINLDESSDFVLVRHRKYFITTNMSLDYVDMNGKRRSDIIPKLNKAATDELITYLANIGKYRL